MTAKVWRKTWGVTGRLMRARFATRFTWSPRPRSEVLAPGVDERVAAGIEAGEEVDPMQERGVLDNERVRVGDRLAQADLAIVEAAGGHRRRAHGLRAEAREGLGVHALETGGHPRASTGGAHHPLPAAPLGCASGTRLPGLACSGPVQGPAARTLAFRGQRWIDLGQMPNRRYIGVPRADRRQIGTWGMATWSAEPGPAPRSGAVARVFAAIV